MTEQQAKVIDAYRRCYCEERSACVNCPYFLYSRDCDCVELLNEDMQILISSLLSKIAKYEPNS